MRHSHDPACACCFALPPYLTEHLRRHARDRRVRESLALMHEDAQQQRLVRRAALSMRRRAPGAPPAPRLDRRIYDCGKSTDLLKRLVRKEGGRKTTDAAANEAYDSSGLVFRFFETVYKRASVDNQNLPLISSVHYQEQKDVGYDNAFWNGHQMVYGDGDGVLFNRFTIARDVIGHELTHGVTQYEAALKYERQSGALNEHFSDVFGVLSRQWADKDGDPKAADWRVGHGLFKPARLRKMSLRNMKAPGSAYDDAELGRDPQPHHMSGYKDLPNTDAGDWGGVHVNSGIPNFAFYKAASAIGKPAWEVAGRIWYIALCDRLRDNASFAKCAYETISVARDFYDGATAHKVQTAWMEVGVLTAQQRLVAWGRRWTDMRLTIRRVGGQLPTLQPTAVLTDRDLDAATCELARSFVRSPPTGAATPQPDSFRYIFELEDEGALATTSAAFAEIPEALRCLLPTPAFRRT